MLLPKTNRVNLDSSLTSKNGRKLMLFELDTRGHHPGYVQRLLNYWIQYDLQDQLFIVVTQKFLTQHVNIVDLAEKAPRHNIQFIALSTEEEGSLFDSHLLESSFRGRLIRAFQEWRLLQTYATKLQPDAIFLMYLDTLLIRFALGGSLPCPVSALYFRPLLHYSQFPNFKPQNREAFWQWRDRLCLPQLLCHSQLQTLFCLDPYAADYINQTYHTQKARPIPDPVQVYPSQAEQVNKLKKYFQIEPERIVFLLFGVLSERKGTKQVLEAVTHLSLEMSKKICLLLVGPCSDIEREQLTEQISYVRHNTAAQVESSFAFIKDEEIQNYFEITDVILTPYQRHIGMSAVLVRAAAAKKPVLSSDFGLMGAVVRQHQLGLTVDSSCAKSVAEGICQFLSESRHTIGDRAAMEYFAAQNTSEEFSAKIFQDLGCS